MHLRNVIIYYITIIFISMTTADQDILFNYRPISQLPLLAKLLEKTVYYQLIYFLNRFNIFDLRLHAFRHNHYKVILQELYYGCTMHSTETAIIQLLDNLIISAGNKSPTQAIFLDLSSAFDTLDHDILLT